MARKDTKKKGSSGSDGTQISGLVVNFAQWDVGIQRKNGQVLVKSDDGPHGPDSRGGMITIEAVTDRALSIDQ